MQFTTFQYLSYQTSEPQPPIEVFAGISEEQLPGELRFLLLLKNRGDSEIIIENPVDFITYTLVDSEGWPRSLAAPSWRGKVHRSSEKIVDRSPYIVHISTSIIQSNNEQIYQTIEPSLSLATGNKIKQVLSIGGIRLSHDSDDVIEVVSGHYKIDFLLPLRWTDENGRQQINLKSEVLDVELG